MTKDVISVCRVEFIIAKAAIRDGVSGGRQGLMQSKGRVQQHQGATDHILFEGRVLSGSAKSLGKSLFFYYTLHFIAFYFWFTNNTFLFSGVTLKIHPNNLKHVKDK